MPLSSSSSSKMMMGSHAAMLRRVAAALVAVVVVAGVAASAQAPPVTSAQLQQVAGSLQMYVDPLPQMAKILGYGFQQGRVVPVNLTIGMFEKKWVQIPPRPASDAGVRVRAVPRLGHVPWPDDRGPPRRAAVGDVGEPPPRPPHPPLGPHRPHRHPQERRRPHRRAPPRQRPPAAVRRQRLRLVHRRVPRDRAGVVDGDLPVPQRAAPGQPLVPRPRPRPHPRQPPRRPPRRLPHREARGGHAHGPPLRRRRPPPRHRRPQLQRRRLPLHELHGRRAVGAPAVAARVLRRGHHRQRQGVAVPHRAPPPLPLPHPQRQQRPLLQRLALQRHALPRRGLRRLLPRRAGHRDQPPHLPGGDLRRRHRLHPIADARGRDAQLGALPVPDRRHAGAAQRQGDEVRGDGQRAPRPAGQLDGAGPGGAVRERGVAGAGVADEAHRDVRVFDAVGAVHAPLHQRPAAGGPRHGDAEVGDDGAVARHQPHRRQPPAAHPPGHVPGRQDAAARRPAELHRLHDAAQRRRQVRRGPARGGARGAGAGPREDVEERRQGAAGVRHHGGGGVQARRHQPALPLRRHGRARIRLPLPHPGSRGQRHDQATEAASLKRFARSIKSVRVVACRRGSELRLRGSETPNIHYCISDCVIIYLFNM